MKISVVVPVYNTEKYLAICVESLITQTIKPFEIILVDDGSIDRSLEICKSYEQHFNYIKVYHKENEGLGLTRNYGMDRANGDFVLFVDADDYLDIDFIEQMQEKYMLYGYDTCKTCFVRVNDKGEKTDSNVVSKETIFKVDEIKSELVPRLIGSSPKENDAIPMSTCCTLYSLELIRKNNIRFVSEREWISEDIIFNLEYYRFARLVCLSDYIGYNYRINNNSLSTRYLEDRFEKCIKIVNEEKKILLEIGIWDMCQKRLSKQFFIYTKMSILQLNKSGLSKKEVLSKLKSICNEDFLHNMIEEYPIQELGIKQRIFIHLIKNRLYILLYLVTKFY